MAEKISMKCMRCKEMCEYSRWEVCLSCFHKEYRKIPDHIPEEQYEKYLVNKISI